MSAQSIDYSRCCVPRSCSCQAHYANLSQNAFRTIVAQGKVWYKLLSQHVTCYICTKRCHLYSTLGVSRRWEAVHLCSMQRVTLLHQLLFAALHHNWLEQHHGEQTHCIIRSNFSYLNHAILHFFNCFLQITTVGHLCNNVTPSQQLAIYIQLREGWPVKHLFEPLSNIIIRQNIKRLKRFLCSLQGCNNTLTETAARLVWRSCGSKGTPLTP